MNALDFSLLVAACSFVAGLLGSLTGLGGGVVIVPLLTLAFHVDIRYAIGASLMSVIATSSGSAAAYVREGFSNIRIGMFLEVATTLGALLGNAAAAIFMTALLASGLSSSVVGTMAGQVIMQDFVGWRIPLWLRRLVTMAPTVLVVAWGVDVTEALIVSQVVLSLVLPVPMTAVIYFTGSRRIMGPLANPRWLSVVAACITLATPKHTAAATAPSRLNTNTRPQYGSSGGLPQ